MLKQCVIQNVIGTLLFILANVHASLSVQYDKHIDVYKEYLVLRCISGHNLNALIVQPSILIVMITGWSWWLHYQPAHLRLFSHDGKVRNLNFNSRCAFWIKIQNTQKRLCVCQITLQNVIWNAHLKSRYRGVFQLRFSQITQRNLCMNDLTSESCFGGRS